MQSRLENVHLKVKIGEDDKEECVAQKTGWGGARGEGVMKRIRFHDSRTVQKTGCLSTRQRAT